MMGAKPKYDRPKWIASLCDWLTRGKPQEQWHRANPDGPSRSVLYNWAEEDEEIAASVARARDLGYDVIAEHCVDIADSGDSDDVPHRKLRIETRQKLLACWKPAKYNPGSKVAVGGDPDAPPIRVMTDVERETRIAAIVGAASSRLVSRDTDDGEDLLE